MSSEVPDRQIISAFDRGAYAARSGRPRADNPYRPLGEDEEYQAWEAGWEWEPKSPNALAVNALGRQSHP